MKYGLLGDHAEILSGFAFKSSNFNVDGHGMPLVRIRDVVPGETSTFYDGVFEDRFVVEPGDTLIGMDGDFNRALWKSAPALLNQRVCKITACGGLDQRYLYHLLPQLLRVISDRTPFVTVKHLSTKDLKETEIPLPPLEEQKRIAAILDQADALRRLRRHALDRLNTLGQAIFHEMFGSSLEYRTIEELIKEKIILVHKDGNHGSSYPRKEEFGLSGIPFLSAKAIDEAGTILPDCVEYLNEEKAHSLKIGWIQEGDVLLSHNASVGKVSLYGGQFGSALIGTSLTCIRPNAAALSSEFLKHFLKGPDFQAQLKANMSQTTRNQVPITAQRQLKLPIPAISEQKRFEVAVSKLKPQRDACSNALRRSETLFTSLQHRAFWGEL